MFMELLAGVFQSFLGQLLAALFGFFNLGPPPVP